MHLPERMADSAIYLLSGQLPLVADLHKRVLSTLDNVFRSNLVERRIAEVIFYAKAISPKSGFSMSTKF